MKYGGLLVVYVHLHQAFINKIKIIFMCYEEELFTLTIIRIRLVSLYVCGL